MKQSNNREKTIALYLRISREDQGRDESYSIINQRKLLQKAAIDKGFTKFVEFVDDGITGTKRDRKELVRMLAELEKAMESATTAEIFIATVRKYTRAKKLTERMLNELIERIEVHQAEKVDGVQVQKLTIHYNCVGTIDIPNLLLLPEPELSMKMRKGVAVCYAPQVKAG